jgi:hypothetical protein
MAVDFSPVSVWCARVRFVRKLLSGAGGLADRAGGYGPWYDGREDYWGALVGRLDENGQWRDRIGDEEAFARWGGVTENVPLSPVTLNPVRQNRGDVTLNPVASDPEVKALAKRRGRPSTGEAMTAAERKRQSRLRKAGSALGAAVVPEGAGDQQERLRKARDAMERRAGGPFRK